MAMKRKPPEPETPRVKANPKTATKPKAKPKTRSKQAATVPKMEDVAKGQAEVREGRVDREQDEAAHLASVS